MRTRRALYPSLLAPCFDRRQSVQDEAPQRAAKRARVVQNAANASNCFDALPDDLMLSIFIALSSSAGCPADLINAMLTCKRFQNFALNSLVLSNVSVTALKVKPSQWSDGSHRFLTRCAETGNPEACYILGMIRFYCLLDRESGLHLMAWAARSSHSCALHSLAIIQFNGSGRGRVDKNLRAGVGLCAKAAALNHVDAMREYGHCLQDGYGVPKNVMDGRRLILEANAREAAAAVAANSKLGNDLPFTASKIALGCFRQHFFAQNASRKVNKLQQAALQHAALHISDYLDHHPVHKFLQSGGCSLLSDFGCNVPPPKAHIANEFLVDWFALHPPAAGLRLCSHANCGRPETRKHEFRRCSACGSVNYCSRACQALDWKLQHKFDCMSVANWENNPGGGDIRVGGQVIDDS